MKEIKTFADIDYIMSHGLDVTNSDGHVIPFLRLAMMKLYDVVMILDTGWTYEIQ